MGVYLIGAFYSKTINKDQQIEFIFYARLHWLGFRETRNKNGPKLCWLS